MTDEKAELTDEKWDASVSLSLRQVMQNNQTELGCRIQAIEGAMAKPASSP